MATLSNERQLEYIEFLNNHKKGHFLQSPQWAKVKDNWKNEVVIANDANGNIVGSMSLLIRRVPIIGRTIMYSPRGPVCDIHNKEVLLQLLNGARELAKKHKSYVLKIDPDVLATDVEFINIMKSIGFDCSTASKNFEGIQPRFVFRLDISNKTVDEVMASFESKTRYNIRVAQKKGVTVEVGTRDDLVNFQKIMNETGTRDKFVVRSLEYFQKMFDCLSPENMRLYNAYFDGKYIAGTLAIFFGNKMWYLYGASSNDYRNVMPNYLLQWEMIKWAIEKKCDIYDFRGVSGDIDESNPLYGLYRFKKGFNGDFTEFVGELNCVFNPTINFAVQKSEHVFRELRKQLYLLKGQKSTNERTDN